MEIYALKYLNSISRILWKMSKSWDICEQKKIKIHFKNLEIVSQKMQKS